ncbi:MAG: peptidoglycan DD-metalloendopeptidase family protein [Armatimonadetes bacterium]|nr:peptidoglycan DD-metalloendopeptidase family protein [Armatimonadota bacterium]
MRTLTSRGYYVRQIVASDVALVKEIEAAREQIERDKEAQAAEVERIAALQADLIRNRDETAELASQKETQLQAIENDREKYERMLAALEAESEKIEASIMALQATPRGQQRLARKFSGGLGQPVSGRITSRFGYRVHPITGVRSLHRGVDLACPTGTPVHAAASGEVIMAGWMGAYGYAVVIDHGGGVSTLYGHNSRLLTGVGAQVSKGQVIARSGSTGWSTGPHVHFEKRVNGRPVNPL